MAHPFQVVKIENRKECCVPLIFFFYFERHEENNIQVVCVNSKDCKAKPSKAALDSSGCVCLHGINSVD